MHDFDSDRFIDGIYNYCDRWCERCRFTDRCFLYHQEQEATGRQEPGQDPNDLDMVMQNVASSLDEALRMLRRMAEAEGIDLEAFRPTEPVDEFDYQKHTLYQRIDRWGGRLERLLERVGLEMPEQGEQLIRQLDEGEIKDPTESLEALHGVRDACDVLSRYRYLVVVKTARIVSGWARADEEPDPDYARFPLGDAIGTAKLVYECLGQCIAALWQLAEFHRPWLDEALPCALEAEGIRHALDAAYPEHRSFRRPGLDDG